jgi:hypothetical protein
MRWGERKTPKTADKKKRSTRRKVVAIAAATTVAAAGAMYLANKTSVDAFLSKALKSNAKVSSIPKATINSGKKYVVENLAKTKADHLNEANLFIKNLREELADNQKQIRSAKSIDTAKMYRENMREIESAIKRWEAFAKSI